MGFNSAFKGLNITGNKWQRILAFLYVYSRTPLIRINWDDEQSGYAENPDKWIFLWKYATLAVWSGGGGEFVRKAVLGYIFIYVQIKQ